MATNVATQHPPRKAGLAFWMERALYECDRASVNLAPDPVHDLRVALRRCRSVADGLTVMDPNPDWKKMKKAGKRLFSSLGDLRDVQVMQEWVHRFDSANDPVTTRLLDFLTLRETHLKSEAAQALQQFDRKQWRRWSKSLPGRARRLKPGTLIFKHLALERWTEARELHRRALRDRSQVAFHRLRIGLKRFRYIVENFLPEQHAAWGHDLKSLQDLLGEVHDLDVLWATAMQVNAFPDLEARSHWHAKIREERDRRIETYRERMLGKGRLWDTWRAELPRGEQAKTAAWHRLRLWASALDPNVKHSSHVARLALQLYDGLGASGQASKPTAQNERQIVRLAAMLQDVGRSRGEKGHHKATFRLIHRLAPPLGLSRPLLHMAGTVARYHRGALPRSGQRALRGLSLTQRAEALRLAGVLRLANAFDAAHDGRIQRLEVHRHNGFVVIAAEGYSARDRSAESIAAARHLLEIVYRRPVMVKALRPAKTSRPRQRAS